MISSNYTDHLYPFSIDLSVTNTSPPDWTFHMYGYIMPFVVLITTCCNGFIIRVLCKKHLINATNCIISIMAVHDLIKAWSSLIWTLFYYTFHSYRDYNNRVGMNIQICKLFSYSYVFIPDFCHTATTFITAYLGVQRYLHIRSPHGSNKYNKIITTIRVVALLDIIAIIFVCIGFLTKEIETTIINGVSRCKFTTFRWFLDIVDEQTFKFYIFSFRGIGHLIPCYFLTTFTYKLIRKMNTMEHRKRSLIGNNPERQSSHAATGGRRIRTTNRMLSVVCIWFIIIEIAAVMISIGKILIFLGLFIKFPIAEFIINLNATRNLLIVMSSPVQFIIYCSMSQDFRITVRQMFTKEQLYKVRVQNTVHGVKRYSIILLDRRDMNSGNRKQSRFSISDIVKKLFKQENVEMIELNITQTTISENASSGNLSTRKAILKYEHFKVDSSIQNQEIPGTTNDEFQSFQEIESFNILK